MTVDVPADGLLARYLKKTLDDVIVEETPDKRDFDTQHPGSIAELLFVYLTQVSRTWSETSGPDLPHDPASLLTVSKVLEKTGDRLIDMFFTVGPPLASDENIWCVVNRTTAVRYRLLPHILAQVSES